MPVTLLGHTQTKTFGVSKMTIVMYFTNQIVMYQFFSLNNIQDV